MVKGFRPKVGDEVFLQPIGNAARHWNGEPKIARVTAVKRKFFYVSGVAGSCAQGFPIELGTGRWYDHDNNLGYNAFPTEAAFHEHIIVTACRKKLAQNNTWIHEAPDEIISRVCQILEDEALL